MAETEISGIFTFKQVFNGILFFNADAITSCAAHCAAVKSASAEKFAKENPMDGIPSIAPSTAADMVPEYNTFVDVFSP